MRKRVLIASSLSLWVLLPFLAAPLAQERSSIAIATFLYIFAAVSIFTGTLLAAPVQRKSIIGTTPVFSRWMLRLLSIYGVILVFFQIAIVLRILAERGEVSWIPIKEFASYLAESLSPLVPALQKFPQDMIRNGFSQTAQLVTDTYALAYAAALINIGISLPILVWLLLRHFGRRELASVTLGFENMPKWRKYVVLFGWPILLAIYILFVFIETDVRAIPRRKEYLAHFETSEFHLYFKSLIGTGLGTVFACAYALFIVASINVYAARFLHRSKDPLHPAIG